MEKVDTARVCLFFCFFLKYFDFKISGVQISQYKNKDETINFYFYTYNWKPHKL
jgi:hypothetical protein